MCVCVRGWCSRQVEGAEGREQVGSGADGGLAAVFAGQNPADSQQTPQSLRADPGSGPEGEAALSYSPAPVFRSQHPQCTASTLPPPQKQQSAQLSESLNKAQNALQSCDHQLGQLRAQAEEARRQLMEQQQVRDK